jgi:hypothetical protein
MEQTVGLEALDPRHLNKFSNRDIRKLLCEHAYWAYAVALPRGLPRLSVLETLHRL